MHGAGVGLAPRRGDVRLQVRRPRISEVATAVHRRQLVDRRRSDRHRTQAHAAPDSPGERRCSRPRTHRQAVRAVDCGTEGHVAAASRQVVACTQNHRTRVGLVSCRGHIPVQVGGTCRCVILDDQRSRYDVS